uniref:PDZ domain-containing protein n=1 Tax=Noctiluca scintillans TaxID=2966 RepID=A0A7S1AE40_NOCSC|mmetsp:Transcript_41672/g.110291  ORF Transcript_41672/g.110291 Transcript_41672/m.110291 type:complete len:172 (+) Transcript_41672:102-617(+)
MSTALFATCCGDVLTEESKTSGFSLEEMAPLESKAFHDTCVEPLGDPDADSESVVESSGPNSVQVADWRRVIFECTTLGGEATRHFMAELEPSENKFVGLGLRMLPEMGVLRIEVLEEGGVAQMWNDAHPEHQLRPGVLIVQVNGNSEDVRWMVNECAQRKHLTLTCRRPL